MNYERKDGVGEKKCNFSNHKTHLHKKRFCHGSGGGVYCKNYQSPMLLSGSFLILIIITVAYCTAILFYYFILMISLRQAYH